MILIDSSFLFALYNSDDKYHHQAVNFAGSLTQAAIVPMVVLTEVTYLLKRDLGQIGMNHFLQKFSETRTPLEPVWIDDLYHTYRISHTYSDAKFDFVDCCLMALSERLNVTQICTFDRRDFSIFRPKHCSHLELLP